MFTTAHKFFMNNGEKKSAYKTGNLDGSGTITDIIETGFGSVDGFILYITDTAAADSWDINSCTYITFCDLTTGSPIYATYGTRIYNETGAGIVCDKECYNNLIYFRTGNPRYTTTQTTGTVSKIVDGIKITWNRNLESQTNYIYNIMFFKGVKLHVGHIQVSPTANGFVTYSSCPFTPQAGIFITTNQTQFSTKEREGNLGFGIFAGNKQQSYRIFAIDDYGDPSECYMAYSNNSFTGGPSSNLNHYTLSNITSNGFRLTTANNDNAYYFGFILFGELLNYDIIQTNAPTSNSTINYSYGFKPDVLIPTLVGRTTVGEDQELIRAFSGLYSRHNNSYGGFSNFVENNNYGTASAFNRYVSTSLVYINDKASNGGGASGVLSSINSDGHSIAWTKISSTSQFLGATLAIKL